MYMYNSPVVPELFADFRGCILDPTITKMEIHMFIPTRR